MQDVTVRLFLFLSFLFIPDAFFFLLPPISFFFFIFLHLGFRRSVDWLLGPKISLPPPSGYTTTASCCGIPEASVSTPHRLHSMASRKCFAFGLINFLSPGDSHSFEIVRALWLFPLLLGGPPFDLYRRFPGRGKSSTSSFYRFRHSPNFLVVLGTRNSTLLSHVQLSHQHFKIVTAVSSSLIFIKLIYTHFQFSLLQLYVIFILNFFRFQQPLIHVGKGYISNMTTSFSTWIITALIIELKWLLILISINSIDFLWLI